MEEKIGRQEINKLCKSLGTLIIKLDENQISLIEEDWERHYFLRQFARSIDGWKEIKKPYFIGDEELYNRMFKNLLKNQNESKKN